jgi:hypothetical protein
VQPVKQQQARHQIVAGEVVHQGITRVAGLRHDLHQTIQRLSVQFHQ